jgi:hypothetical protein
VDACLLIRELGARQLTFHHRTVGAVTLEPQLGACTAVEPGGSNGKRVDGPAASLQTGLEAGCIPVPWEAESDYSIALVGASPVSAVRMARTLSENGRGPHMLLAVPGSRRIGMQTRAPQVSRATWLLGGGGVLIEICTRVVCAFVDVESMSQELIARLVEQGLPVYGYIDSHELLPRGYVSILHHAKLLSGVLVPEGDVAQVLLGLDLGNARLHQYATRRDLLSTMEALVAESRRRGTHEY